ncbi:MAG: peptidyl-prolyl cis-trans isomerase [Vicinamibacteria bacterium]
MKQIWREPLVHFLALGAALFLWYGVSGGGPASDRRIVITPGQIDQMVEIFGKTWQRPPTPQELAGLIDDYVREEVLFREAMAMGLDRDDTIIRRRLRQKVEFLAEDLIPTADPTDEQMEQFLAKNPGLFRIEPRVSFRHIYFSRDRRGDTVADDAAKSLGPLRAGGDPTTFGDPIPMPEDFESVSGRDVAGLFGQDFARELMQVEVGRWTGPLESGYGLHLVFVREIAQGRLPDLDEAREAVEREWASARRREANDAFYQSLRERYTVSVEFPDWAQPSPAAPESAP